MRAFLNQHSFVLGVLIALAAAWAITRRLRRRARLAVLAAVTIAALGVFLALRTGPGDLASPTGLDEALRGGRPVFLELYSDY